MARKSKSEPVREKARMDGVLSFLRIVYWYISIIGIDNTIPLIFLCLSFSLTRDQISPPMLSRNRAPDPIPRRPHGRVANLRLPDL